jgi:hypothetical protein
MKNSEEYVMSHWRFFLRSLHILATVGGLVGLTLVLRAHGVVDVGDGRPGEGDRALARMHEQPASSAKTEPLETPKPEIMIAQATTTQTPKVTNSTQPENRQTRLDTLSDALLKRLDEAERAEADWADQRITAAFAHNAMIDARRSLETARKDETEYEKSIYPAERKTMVSDQENAEAEHKQAVTRLEWLGRMLKNQLTSEASRDQAEHQLHRTELWVAEEKAKVEKLENYTRPHKLAALRADIARASDELAARMRSWERELARESGLEALARSAALTDTELKTLALVKEIDSVFTDGNAAPAEPKLKEAEALWTQAVAERLKSKRADQRLRLRRALEKRPSELPPPKPQPAAVQRAA